VSLSPGVLVTLFLAPPSGAGRAADAAGYQRTWELVLRAWRLLAEL